MTRAAHDAMLLMHVETRASWAVAVHPRHAVSTLYVARTVVGVRRREAHLAEPG